MECFFRMDLLEAKKIYLGMIAWIITCSLVSPTGELTGGEKTSHPNGD